MQYLILQNPGHNRVYYNMADKLALAELKIACKRLSAPCTKIETIEIERIRYLSFKTDYGLSEKDINILSRLSFAFAIYSLKEMGGQKYLAPIGKIAFEFVDGKIGTILKYKGKTNELFTKMMLNLALLTSDFDYSDRIRLLDPVAGRGTTLFEGLIYGFDVYGLEIGSGFVHDTEVFFRKYLEKEHLKHTFAKSKVSGNNRSKAVHMREFEFAKTKEEFKAGKAIRRLGLVCGDAGDTSKFFPKNSFHLIVGDLPYGISHGSRSQKKKAAASRNPSGLLESCIRDWHKVLKKGGAIVLAWNSFLFPREKLSGIFAANGFKVISPAPYDQFEHKVDSSIKRDVIVGKKTIMV